MENDIKNKNRTVLLVVCIVIIAVLVTTLVLVLHFKSTANNKVNDNLANQDKVQSNNVTNNKDKENNSTSNDNNEGNSQTSNNPVNSNNEINRESATRAVLLDIMPCAGWILTERDGDISAPFIGITEFSNKIDSFIPKLVNKTDIINVYKENNIVYAKYEAEKVLDAIGYSAHNNVGITIGMQTIAVDVILNERNSTEVSNKERKTGVLLVMQNISQYGDMILSALEGNVGAPIVGKFELKQDASIYADILLRDHNFNNLIKIYKKNGKVYCEYEVEKVINALGYSTHMGVGVPKGMQTAIF